MGGWNIVYALINFAILAFVLVKFGKKTVLGMIEGNRRKISEELDAAKAAEDTETLCAASSRSLEQHRHELARTLADRLSQ